VTADLYSAPGERGRERGATRGRSRAWSRPGRADGCARAGAARTLGDGLRGRLHRRRARPHGALQRLPLRHRRPPLLHEAQAGRPPVAGDARRRAPRPAAPVAHLLRPPVLPLPAGRDGRDPTVGPPRVGALRALVRTLSRRSPERPGDLRGVGDDPLRPPPVRRVLPLVHREGLGDPRQRDPLGVGGAADQELLALQGPPQHPAGAARARDDADRRVPVPTARARTDVGSVPRSARRPGSARPTSSSRS